MAHNQDNDLLSRAPTPANPNFARSIIDASLHVQKAKADQSSMFQSIKSYFAQQPSYAKPAYAFAVIALFALTLGLTTDMSILNTAPQHDIAHFDDTDVILYEMMRT